MDQYQQELLLKVSKGEISVEEATKLFGQKQPKGISFDISPKGGVKIKGIRQRWGGLVLYPNEVDLILSNADKLVAFIEANKDKLSMSKDQPPADAAA